MTLEPGWASRNVPSPLGPIVVNGVVFAAASGNRSTRAVLYALDGDTGRELWTSRAAITSFAQGGLVAGAGQVYLVTYDNSSVCVRRTDGTLELSAQNARQLLLTSHFYLET